MKCPQCGHQNAKHYKFCLECGAEIPSTSVESPQRSAVKRVGFSDAFEPMQEKSPSPATLIRQVEDISSGIGMGNPLTTPPPLGLKSEGDRSFLNQFSTPASPKEMLSSSSPLDSKLTPSSIKNEKTSDSSSSEPDVYDQDTPPPIRNEEDDVQADISPKGGLLRADLITDDPATPDLDFHTNLNEGRDSLADFERELFGGELSGETDRAKNISEEAPPNLDALGEVGKANKASDPPPLQEAPPAPLTCRNCGATIPADFLFCGKCGTKVEADVDVASDHTENVVDQSNEQESSMEAVLPSPSQALQVGEAKQDVPESPPIVQTYVKLIHIHLDGSEGESIEIKEKSATLGRDHSWEVFDTDEYLSPQHARIEVQESGAITLTDLGGINGIFIRLTKPVTLESGDFFRAGQQLFSYENLSADHAVTDQQGTKRLGSPIYETWGRLSHIVGQGEVGRSWLLHGELTTLGRVKGDIVFDQDRFMSSRHCSLTLSQGQVTLTDQGSTNGTFVRIRQSIIVQDEDLILLGQKIFKVKTV